MNRHTLEMDRLRKTVQSLCQSSNDLVSNARLYEVFGLEGDDERARLRSRIGDLVKRKELVRVADGIYSYNRHAAPKRDGECFLRIWRAVRCQAPGFSYQQISLVSGREIKGVRQYMKFLIQEGYIAEHGRKGNTRLFRVTQKGKARRDTPFMPRPIPDPFQKERDAACRMVRALMDTDPHQPKTQSQIAADCRIILERFEKTVLQKGGDA